MHDFKRVTLLLSVHSIANVVGRPVLLWLRQSKQMPRAYEAEGAYKSEDLFF